jgi:hypothetical protein
MVRTYYFAVVSRRPAMAPLELDPAVLPLKRAAPKRFLDVRRGDAVVVGEPGRPWWVGRVYACSKGSRVQAYCVDTGQVADLAANWVIEILERDIHLAKR